MNLFFIAGIGYTATYSQVITPASRLGDLIGNKVILLKGFPDTLTIGSFRLIVEQYERGGIWEPLTKTYKQLSGIGRIKFGCQPSFPFPWWDVVWKDAFMKPVSIKVVDSVKVDNGEISIRDAAVLGIQARAGSTVDILLPHVDNRAVDLVRYLTDITPLKRLSGIRVEFKNLTVSVTKAGATKGVVTAGTATYPSALPVPDSPFTLPVSPGFRLAVSELTIFHNQPARAVARLSLPNSLTANNQCKAGSLNLGAIQLSQQCEFYKELPDSTYGIFGVGATTLAIGGRGYVVDFSTTRQYLPSGKPLPWKGVVLLAGSSKGSPVEPVISNIGFLQGQYIFSNGIVETNGLTAAFTNTAPFRYQSSQPLGYTISFINASLKVVASKVSGGSLQNGTIQLPHTAVRQITDAAVILDHLSLSVNSNMSLSGHAALPDNTGLYWGDLIAAGGGNRKSFGVENVFPRVLIYFSAGPRQQFFPTTTDGKSFVNPLPSMAIALLDSFAIQGATFFSPGFLIVNTPDIPGVWQPNNPAMPPLTNPVRFELKSNELTWLNVATEGVNCSINSPVSRDFKMDLGNPSQTLYVGKKPFNVRYGANQPGNIILQCVESSVLKCDFRAFVDLAEPMKTSFAFKEMVFTSTANNAGGKIAVGGGGSDTMAYWGLKLLPKPGFSSAGLMSVKTGQIVLTAAGLSEPRHFAQPFWINWGEILANGEVGRLFFDNNSAGQKFDGFNFIHNAVALSPFIPAAKSFLRVGGNAHFPFFGGNYLHIVDSCVPALPNAPFNKRSVNLSNTTATGFLATDFNVNGNWSDGLGIFDFTLAYNKTSQDGFTGTGTSILRNLLGGNITSTLDMNSRGTCIRVGSNLDDQRAIALGPVANISNITRIWGCACIINDGIENLVVGGEITNAANVSIAARTGSHLSAVMQLTPSLARLTVDGEAYLSLVAALDAVVNGHMQLTMNFAQGFLEGEVQGKMRVASGVVLVGNSLEAEGQANWHIGIDFHELQGMVALRVMGFGGGTDLGAGIYIGKNAPKSRAWVLIGNDPRFGLNTAALPDRLTGIYGFIHLKKGVNLYVVSGEYEIFLGLGAFVLTPEIATQLGGITPTIGLPYAVGNLGGRIHGEILGGLVSAGAYFNLQIIGPYPFHFEGIVGLEGCVVWVVCGSVDITVGLNTSEGFYIK